MITAWGIRHQWVYKQDRNILVISRIITHRVFIEDLLQLRCTHDSWHCMIFCRRTRKPQDIWWTRLDQLPTELFPLQSLQLFSAHESFRTRQFSFNKKQIATTKDKLHHNIVLFQMTSFYLFLVELAVFQVRFSSDMPWTPVNCSVWNVNIICLWHKTCFSTDFRILPFYFCYFSPHL